MPKNSGSEKTCSLSFRIEKALDDKISEEVQRGKFSSKSACAIQALIEYFQREEDKALMKYAIQAEIDKIIESYKDSKNEEE